LFEKEPINEKAAGKGKRVRAVLGLLANAAGFSASLGMMVEKKKAG